MNKFETIKKTLEQMQLMSKKQKKQKNLQSRQNNNSTSMQQQQKQNYIKLKPIRHIQLLDLQAQMEIVQTLGIINLLTYYKIHTHMDANTTDLLMHKRYSSQTDDNKIDLYPPTLHYQLLDHVINIKVVSDDPHIEVCSWQLVIQSVSACSEVLANFFESIQQLYDYLKDKQNIKVDCANGTLSILLKTTIRNKQTTSQIARLKMSPTNTIDLRTISLQKIVQFCDSDQQISNKTTKSFLKTIAQQLLKVPQHNQLDEQLNPLITKIKSMGEQTQTLQSKFGVLFTELHQFREEMSREVVGINNKISNLVIELKDYIQTIKEGIDREMIRGENKYEIIGIDLKETRQQTKILNKQIQDLETQLMRTKLDMGKLVQIQKPQKKAIDSIIDTNQPFIKHFKVINNTVTKTTQTEGLCTIVVGTQPLNKYPRYRVRLQKVNMYPIMIGMIDARHRNQQYCGDYDKRIWCSSVGQIYDGVMDKKDKKMEFKDKDVIIVQYLGEAGAIRWVKGNSEVIMPVPKGKIVWLPCVWIGGVGDAVTFLSQD